MEDEAELLKSLTQEISTVKSEQIPLEHYYSSSVSDEIFRRIYREYQEKMAQKNLLDYDDLLDVPGSLAGRSWPDGRSGISIY